MIIKVSSGRGFLWPIPIVNPCLFQYRRGIIQNKSYDHFFIGWYELIMI